jgi:thiol-disulfide isomerase/thioredoxin
MIVIAGAEWCSPCRTAKEQIGKVAYILGIQLGVEDMGKRENFNENKGRLEDQGYVFTRKGIPAFFKNKKQIDPPITLRHEHIEEWLRKYS